MSDLVMSYIPRENDERPAVASIMSNGFVGGLGLSDGEWQQAQKKRVGVSGLPDVTKRRDRVPTPRLACPLRS
jgi:hypothetical protein